MTSAPRVLLAGPPDRLGEVLLEHADVVQLPVADSHRGGPPGLAWGRRAELLRLDAHVVHLRGEEAVRTWTLPARLARLPVVWQLDEADPRGLRRAGVRPDALLAWSRLALEAGPAARVSTVLPVPVDEPASTSFPSLGPLRRIGVVSTGRPLGGRHAMLEAFAAASSGTNGLQAVVSLTDGDAEDQRRLQSLAAALGVGRRVRFIEGSMRPYLADLDAFVHLPPGPSPTPVRVVEAMAAGVPVVGALKGADAEVIDVGATGLLVDPDDPADVTLQLMRLDLDTALRSRLAAGGLRRAQDYLPERTVSALLEVYRTVAPSIGR